MKKAWSWGNYPLAEHDVQHLQWRNEMPSFAAEMTYLPYGYGRSYGDVPINDGGGIINTQWLNRIIEFDSRSGIFHCEAGLSFREILRFIVPRGWFLPVTPGTQFVSIGGAIANDVHGKNHHGAGTMGCHVLGFELLRSNGERLWCSAQENSHYFAATIGGLGLTGLITTVKIQLLKVASAGINTQVKTFANLEQGLDLFDEHANATYTVAWVDCLARGDQLGRGIFSKGEHAPAFRTKRQRESKLSVPINFPSFSLNKWSVKAFNELYFRNGIRTEGEATVHYEPFFYPLDGIKKWNRIYGRRGFFQHQCAIPFGTNGEGKAAIRKLLDKISSSGNASFLAVLKIFGNKPSPGMLSFPLEGITLALDFPNKGKRTLTLLNALDDIVRTHNGRIYPAKDARMSAEDFQVQYPNWQNFCEYIDPKFNSNFWRRVTPPTEQGE